MNRPPAHRVLILGDNDLASLAVVRSLGRANLEVHLVVFEQNRVTQSSKYIHTCHHFGHPLRDPQYFVSKVLSLISSISFDLVIPTSDKTLVPLIPKRDEINSLSRFVGPDERGFKATNDKRETLSVAEKVGIPIPWTLRLNDTSDLQSFSWPNKFPLVLKPVTSVMANVERRNEVRIVRSSEELVQRLPEMLGRSPLLIQEFCMGHGVGINIIANNGNVFAAFQYERIHEPADGGASSYRKSIPLSVDLLDAVKNFCQEINWTGPAMFEFKVDSSSGRSFLMEVNGRFWGSLALPIGAGIDFPRLLYNMLVFHSLESTYTYRTNFFVRHTIRDIKWFFGNLRTPKGRPDLHKVEIIDLCKEVGNLLCFREGYDLESFSDPMPAMRAWTTLLKDCVIIGKEKIGRMSSQRRFQKLAARIQRKDVQLLSQLRQRNSILFVCFGNINRSTFASAYCQKLMGAMKDSIKIGAAGFYDRPGRETSQLSLEVAKSLGVDLGGHLSQTITLSMLDQYEIVVLMESAHMYSLEQINSRYAGLILPLGAFGPVETTNIEIFDPHGKDSTTFHHTYSHILTCVNGLVRYLAEPKLPKAGYFSGSGCQKNIDND